MKDLIIVRGGGDIATGTIYKLVKSCFQSRESGIDDRSKWRNDQTVASDRSC